MKVFQPIQAFTARLPVEFCRYFGAGCLAFLVDFSLLLALTELFRLNYLVANAVSFSGGLLTAYILSVVWVFRHRRLGDRKKKEFAIFAVLAGAGLIVNELLIWSLVEFAALHYAASKIAATGVIFVGNYFLRRTILFSRPGDLGEVA